MAGYFDVTIWKIPGSHDLSTTSREALRRAAAAFRFRQVIAMVSPATVEELRLCTIPNLRLRYRAPSS